MPLPEITLFCNCQGDKNEKFCKFYQHKEGTLPNSFYKASIILILQPKTVPKPKKLQTITSNELRQKYLQQNTIKRIILHD